MSDLWTTAIAYNDPGKKGLREFSSKNVIKTTDDDDSHFHAQIQQAVLDDFAPRLQQIAIRPGAVVFSGEAVSAHGSKALARLDKAFKIVDFGYELDVGVFKSDLYDLGDGKISLSLVWTGQL